MTYSSQSGTGEKCYSNIFTGKLAFAFTGEGLLNSSGPACLIPLPSCDTPVPEKDSFSGALNKYLCLILKVWPDVSNCLAIKRESLARLLECHTLQSSCSDCHQEKGKDKPREVMILQPAVAELGLGPLSTPKHWEQITDQRKDCTQRMSACLLIDFTVYFLLNTRSSSGSRKGTLTRSNHRGGFWGRKKTGAEKPCNLTVAIEEADVQSRVHIWNCSLPASKHAEGALNISSGYGTTYQSMLRKLPSIYGQKSEQWHTEEFSFLPGGELLSLGCKLYLRSSALLLGRHSASPREASTHRQPFGRHWAPVRAGLGPRANYMP